MSLRNTAEEAEDMAAGLLKFRERLPENETEITGLIADLYAISVSLKSLNNAIANCAYRHILPRVNPDLDLVRRSVQYTLDDIFAFFGELEIRRGPKRDVFARTWKSMCTFFRNEAQYSLSTRLGKFKLFLEELLGMIKGKHPDARTISKLHSNVKALLQQQEAEDSRLTTPRPLTLTMPNFTSDPDTPLSPANERRLRNRRSFERRRPSSTPQSPLSPASGAFSDGAFSSASSGNQSMASNPAESHWAKSVFQDTHSITPLPSTSEISKCFGEPTPGLKPWLRQEGFVDLFQLAFNIDGDTDLRVFMFFRPDDHRARILLKAPHSRRPSDYYCMPLNLLEIFRHGNCLQLRRRKRGRDELWARLRFTTIERMVTFFCTFLALRAQDCGKPVEEIQDYDLRGEVQFYGGQIVDDNYLHALRIYQDATTGVVRLQASVHRGDMTRAPVWTAFVTEYLNKKDWMRPAASNSKTVILLELTQSIFFQDYTPPMNGRGEYILKFLTEGDAVDFINVMNELAGNIAEYR